LSRLNDLVMLFDLFAPSHTVMVMVYVFGKPPGLMVESRSRAVPVLVALVVMKGLISKCLSSMEVLLLIVLSPAGIGTVGKTVTGTGIAVDDTAVLPFFQITPALVPNLSSLGLSGSLTTASQLFMVLPSPAINLNTTWPFSFLKYVLSAISSHSSRGSFLSIKNTLPDISPLKSSIGLNV